MKIRRAYVFILVLASLAARAQERYSTQWGGVSFAPRLSYPGAPKTIAIRFMSASIVEVTSFSGDALEPGDTSLSVLPLSTYRVKWQLGKETDSTLSLGTDSLDVHINLNTGALSFYGRYKKLLLREKPMGRSFQPVWHEGRKWYKTQQVFQTTADDAWYGLGQHQEGLMDYRSYGVQLFQNNTEVAIPFLVSKKNYGVLWDNYSITRAGDLRPYEDLNALRLYAEDGAEGWLTARYKNDRDGSIIEKAESSIRYEYLNDSKLLLPASFDPAHGSVSWTGSVSSHQSGLHRLYSKYAGYLKVWINDSLVLDRWRQAWNPGTAYIDLPLEAGEHKKLRIEWRPDGGESYLSFKYQPPLTREASSEFGFASEAGSRSVYYFIAGANMDSVISGYRQLTGRATLLPQWAFGKWQSRERYKTQKEILDIVEEFRTRGLPLDNIVLDWSYWKEADWGSQRFDSSRFPDPARMIKTLHDRYHTHFMISVWPKFYEGIPTYQQFNDSGWLYRRNIADRQRDWIGQGYVSTFYDAFNPSARRGYWNLLSKELYSKGVDAWWLDASEPDILSNVSPQKRIEQMTPTALGPAAAWLNAYPLEQVRGIAEGQLSVDPSRRVCILTRSAFAGSQRYGAAVWSGDIASRWHDMQLQIPAGINFCLSGLPYWTMDIGGFAVEAAMEHAQGDSLEDWRELMTRWYQFGAFVPLFRVHGQYPFREIFNIAPATHPAYKSMKYYDRLRYRLMPYIYSVAGAVYHRNYTMMRGLVMDFESDTNVIHTGDEYMFGPSLLVCPVTMPHIRSKKVYLPAGQNWYDLYTGQHFSGGKWIEADAPYERLPVFVREGSIIPFGPELHYTGEKPADTLTIFVYTGRDAHFELYEDGGLDRGYEKGVFSRIEMEYKESSKSFIVHAREGSFPGMLARRVFRVVWVDSAKRTPLDLNAPATLLHYSGAQQAITKP